MRLFLSLLALWALLAPTLCLAGAFGHACDDCGDEYACAHEEDCLEDPCSEEVIRPASGGGAPDTGAVETLPVLRIHLPAPPVGTTGPAILRPPATCLPLPESDLPLLS